MAEPLAVFQYLDALPVPTLVVRDGSVAFANAACERLTGFGRQELCSQTSPLAQAALSAAGARPAALEGGTATDVVELCLTTRGGEKLRIRLLSGRVELDGGAETIVCLDVPGLGPRVSGAPAGGPRQVDAAGKFASLVKDMPYAYLETDLEGRITFANARAEQLSGWTRECLLAMKVTDFLREEDISRALADLAEAKVGPNDGARVYAIRRRDGSWLDVEVNAVPLRASDQIVGFQITVADITAYRRAEKTLKASLESRRTLLDALPEGVAGSDLQGRLTYLSRRALEMAGYASEEELLGKSSFLFIAPEDRERAAENLRLALRDGVVRDAEYVLLKKDGSRYPVELSAAVVRDADGKPTGFVALLRDVSERKRAEERNEKLELELTALRRDLREKYGLSGIIAVHPKMRAVCETILAVSSTDATVLVQGETGTGKELVAKAVHYNSRRREGPFVKVDCGALAEGLLESELFGHVKGAFTGALRDRPGRFEMADGGTIFLDEIQNLSFALQAKLLRAVQEGRFEKVGSDVTQSADVRIVAATNENLMRLVNEGKFRRDLYYRLNVVSVVLPPLRERLEDLPLLAQHFLKRLAEKHGKSVTGFSNGALARMARYGWPGNVRELENVIEQAVIFCRGDTIQPSDIRLPSTTSSASLKALAPGKSLLQTVREGERRALLEALDEAGGNRRRAAELLGISRSALYKKLKKHSVKKLRG